MRSPPVHASAALGTHPSHLGDVFSLTRELLQLEATPTDIARLTDAIDYPAESEDGGAPPDERLASGALMLKRQRRSQLLTDLLQKDRAAYIETASFLSIPRSELPNRQDVPLRACDEKPLKAATVAAAPDVVDAANAAATTAAPLVDGLNADGLVPDSPLVDQPMGENLAEGALLELTRNIYAGETGVARVSTKGINGLIEEMRTYMLSQSGSAPAAQQGVLIRTLRTLMTPVLPPFYRIFMGGMVPKYDPDDERVGADPKWLADGFQWVRAKLPVGREYLEPGRQLGPWFYAPALTSVVAPFVFGFLVGPAQINRRSDGQLGGLVVEKCKFLQESNCKGMCLNSCKQPAQDLFAELGLDLRVMPNFETHECQWSFGEPAPPAAEDPTWPKGCIVGCTSRQAMKELSGGAQAARACE